MNSDLYFQNKIKIDAEILIKTIRLRRIKTKENNLRNKGEDLAIKGIKAEKKIIEEEISQLKAKKVILTL